MTFTVVFLPAAEDQLTSLWIDFPAERNAITARMAGLEAALHRDPLRVGESREGNERVVYDDPIGLSFMVSEPDRVVQVKAIWHM
jgi:hypothetical protein